MAKKRREFGVLCLYRFLGRWLMAQWFAWSAHNWPILGSIPATYNPDVNGSTQAFWNPISIDYNWSCLFFRKALKIAMESQTIPKKPNKPNLLSLSTTMYFKHCYQKHHALDSWKLYNIKIFCIRGEEGTRCVPPYREPLKSNASSKNGYYSKMGQRITELKRSRFTASCPGFESRLCQDFFSLLLSSWTVKR